MSIFDRFAPKETGGQEKKPSYTEPRKKVISKLDAAGEEAKAQYPNDSKTIDDFVSALKKSYEDRRKRAQKDERQAMRASARFCLSMDRMNAYACMLPPENGGEELALERFLEDMRYEGIRFGVLQEQIQREFAFGYFHIFQIAQGKLPQPGEDGNVTDLFRRNGNMCLEQQIGSQLDFSQGIQLQPIRKGAAICLIRPARPGVDGMDVTGKELPSPQPITPPIPQGNNTAIGKGGQALTALVDGMLYIKDDRFCVHEQKIIDGNLDLFQGTLRVSGNLYVEGNVDGGVEIEVSGEIVINGKLGQARVTSKNGTIRVQQGIYGTEGQTFLKAACQVQSPVMEWAEVEAGADVIAETISNCNIRCDSTVCAANGRGLIVNSQIQAGKDILCLRIGNVTGSHSQFSVGYPPHISETWEKLNSELSEVQPTLDRLWAFITDLRKKGTRISEAERSVLDQLVEQRDLYIEKRESLKSELKVVNKELSRKSAGKIQCEKLYPSLDVRIGRLTETVSAEEDACNIHAGDSRIFLR